MSNQKICNYCGEYEHDCQCTASLTIQKLQDQLTAANSALVMAREKLSFIKQSVEEIGNLAVVGTKEPTVAERCMLNLCHGIMETLAAIEKVVGKEDCADKS